MELFIHCGRGLLCDMEYLRPHKLWNYSYSQNSGRGLLCDMGYLRPCKLMMKWLDVTVYYVNILWNRYICVFSSDCCLCFFFLLCNGVWTSVLNFGVDNGIGSSPVPGRAVSNYSRSSCNGCSPARELIGN